MKDDHKKRGPILNNSPEAGESLSEPPISVNHREQSMQSSKMMMETPQLALEGMGELVVVINKEYEITLLNRAARDFLFVDAAALRPILCRQCDRDRKAPCQEIEENCTMKKIRNSSEPLTWVHEHSTADGRRSVLEITATPLWSKEGSFQGILEITRDVTAQKELHNVLESSKREWQETFDIINEPITIQDRHLTVVRAKKAAAEILGLSFAEIIGRKCYTLFHGLDNPPESCAGCQTLKSGRPATFEMFEPHVNKFLEIKAYPQTNESHEITRLVHLIRDISTRKRIEERLHSLSITDELTGLFNRRGFSTLAERHVKVARRQNKGMLLICVDLDDLKGINDTLGHNTGDMALVETAGILKKTFRESDIISRIGGDEFTVFQIEDEATTPEVLISRLQQNLASRNEKGDQRYHLSFSVGFAYCTPESFISINELLIQADKSMYDQKRYKQAPLFTHNKANDL